jgi:RNA polymerase sigma-70 factor (ECF subfamily)
MDADSVPAPRFSGMDADNELVRRLYQDHAGPVYAFCLRWTGDAQRAEDVVQEVFLRAWRNLATVDLQDRPVRPWLLAVARNLLTDLHRAQLSRPQTVDDRDLAMLPGPDELDRAVESWQVAEALGRLSPEHREVLVHAHWMGRSVAETAALLGVPPGTVKSRTYYALRALRLALDEAGVGV